MDASGLRPRTGGEQVTGVSITCWRYIHTAEDYTTSKVNATSLMDTLVTPLLVGCYPKHLLEPQLQGRWHSQLYHGSVGLWLRGAAVWELVHKLASRCCKRNPNLHSMVQEGCRLHRSWPVAVFTDAETHSCCWRGYLTSRGPLRRSGSGGCSPGARLSLYGGNDQSAHAAWARL